MSGSGAGALALPHATRRVAVVGAGAAGLATVRMILRAGHQVVAFEQAARPGGTWVYDTATDSDVLGASADRRRFHGSMYRDLRTNLPREVMSYRDAPFTPAFMGACSVDPRRYPSHREVLAYLQLYADKHQLHDSVRYSTQVLTARPHATSTSNGHTHAANGAADGSNSSSSASIGPRWQVTSVALDDSGQPAGQPESQVFDALVVANGHYSEPNLPDVPGAQQWPGLQMHSHNYRAPEAFAGQTVVVVGASNSGEDVCREVSAVADQVVVAARTWKDPQWASDPSPYGPRGNISRRGMVSALHPDGRVEFAQGPPLARADAIIFCTGYRYTFPFLEQNPATAALSGQQHVPGLYQHMFVPAIGASLAFVGLPWKIVPFPQFELQAELIARLLSGAAQLPPLAEMQASVAQHYEQLQERGLPLRHSHMMDELQWPYNDWLARAAGVEPLPAWRAEMYAANRVNKQQHADAYRDTWDDEAVLAKAHAQLAAVC